MHKLILILSVFCICSTAAFAQTDPQFTHYMFNTQAVNPAYAGSRDALTVTGLMRSQWMGFPGKPVAQTLTMHTPLVSDHFGIGVGLINDKVGDVGTFSGQVDFAFRFHTGPRSRMALGLKGSLGRVTENLGNTELPDPTDPFFENFQSPWTPNVGFGAYFQHERFYLGFSVPQLLQDILLINQDTMVDETVSGLRYRHYYGIAGAVIDLADRVEFLPTLMYKHTFGAPDQLDLTGRLVFRDKFITGLMYRFREAAGVLMGFNFTEQLTLGYSFDWSFPNATSIYNGGSHEFVLRYDFLFRNSDRMPSPRYF